MRRMKRRAMIPRVVPAMVVLFQAATGFPDSALPPSEAVVDCALGCPAGWVGDGICDGVCYNASCDYDGDDCSIIECTPGCRNGWVGDGACEAECFYPACDFDGGDCECGPGCSLPGIGDLACDYECNTAECGFDAGDCKPAFDECMNGPGMPPRPPFPNTVISCGYWFDVNGDSFVDLRDFAAYQSDYAP